MQKGVRRWDYSCDRVCRVSWLVTGTVGRGRLRGDRGGGDDRQAVSVTSPTGSICNGSHLCNICTSGKGCRGLQVPGFPGY